MNGAIPETESAATLHNLGLKALQAGRFAEALQVLVRASRVASADPRLHNDLGFAYQALGNHDAAVDCYEKALALKPDYFEALANLATTCGSQGRLDEAGSYLERAIALRPDIAELHYNLGNYYSDRQRRQEAIACYRRALTLKPDYAEAHYNLGIMLMEEPRLDEAARCFRAAVRSDSGYAAAYYNLGLVLVKGEQRDEAARCFREAIRLNPGYAEAHYNLGVMLMEERQWEDAARCFREAVRLNPGYAEAHYNLGVKLMGERQWEDAARCFREAVRLNPGYVEAHYNLGCVLMKQRSHAEAMNCFDTVLSLRPDYGDALHNRGHCLLLLGRGDEAPAHFERCLALQPGVALAYDSWLFTLNYLASTRPAAVVSACRRYAEQFEAPLRPSWPMHTNSRDPERRLKVGYVSADFRLHSVAYFMEPLLAHHDRDAVEVYGYYNNTREDAVTARLQARVDHWLPCKGMADEELAARIQADGIDILVDLAGHTAGNRLLVFARKPAPVQVTYLGYPATTGLSAIDYRLVTADTDPPGAEAWHSERLYRLPRSLWCYRPAPDDAGGRWRRPRRGAAASSPSVR